jgi:hypothetical protein
MFRRRRLPPDLLDAFEAFSDVVASVERGSAALTESVPSTRFGGRPLVDTLLEFEEALGEAAARMPAWRRPEVEDAWLRADAGLRSARERAERLRTEAPDPGGFEGLIGLIGDLLAPLQDVAAGAEAFARLRVRAPGRYGHGRSGPNDLGNAPVV